MQPKLIDFANFWLPIIGAGVLLTIAITAWFSDKKKAAIWSGVLGVLCLIVLAGLQIRDAFNKASASDKEASTKGSSAEQLERPLVDVSFVSVMLKNGAAATSEPSPGLNIFFGTGPQERGTYSHLVAQGVLRNDGRLPALKMSGEIYIAFGTSLPAIPDYRDPDRSGWDYSRSMPPPGPYLLGKFEDQLLPVGSSLPINVSFRLVQRCPDPTDSRAIFCKPINGLIWTHEAFFFLYGRVAYSDQLGHSREFGFARRYYPQKAALEEAGGDAYNFDHEALHALSPVD